MRFVGWLFVVLGLLASEMDGHAAPYALRQWCPPPPSPSSPPTFCHNLWMPWSNATFQFPSSPNNPEVNVRIQGVTQTLAIEKITVTTESKTHDIAGADLRDLTTMSITHIQTDVFADQDGDAYITLRIFYDVRVNASGMQEFKVMEIGISKMQSHGISIAQY